MDRQALDDPPRQESAWKRRRADEDRHRHDFGSGNPRDPEHCQANKADRDRERRIGCDDGRARETGRHQERDDDDARPVGAANHEAPAAGAHRKPAVANPEIVAPDQAAQNDHHHQHRADQQHGARA